MYEINMIEILSVINCRKTVGPDGLSMKVWKLLEGKMELNG